MRTPEIQILLSPTILRVASVRKGVAGRSQAIELAPEDWSQTWQGRLDALDAPLRSALTAIGVEGGEPEVRVLYHGPDVLIEAFTHDLDKAHAQRAARSMMSDAHETGTVDRVMADRVLVSQATTDGERTTVLVASDRNASLELLCQWLERCGCRCCELVPLGGAMLAGVVEQLLATEHEGPRAMVHLGEHGTILAASDSGQLVLARMIRFGFEQLVEAYQRALRSEDGECDHALAFESLFGMGVPESRGTVSQALSTAEILPLLQPVLQRYIIEIKQTIRFGLGTVGKGEIELLLTGPGARIPGLPEMLDGQLESCRVGIAPCVASDGPARFESFDRLLRWRSAGVSLSPESLVQTRDRNQLRQVIAAGVVLCVMAIGLDWMATSHKISLVESAVASGSINLIRLQADHEKHVQARNLAGAVVRVDREIRDRFSRSTDLTAILAELSHIVVPGVALTELSAGNEQQGDIVATIRGLVSAGDAPVGHEPLKEYMELLGASPLVKLVDLGSTQHMQVEGNDAVVFSLTIFLHRKSRSIDWGSDKQ